MDLVDTHVHLDDAAFDADREEVIARAAGAGVSALVAIGTDLHSSRRTVALAQRHPSVYAVVGIHPHGAGRVAPQVLHELDPFVGTPRVVAIGETGLDHYREYAPRPTQEALFRAHLALAGAAHLPVVIHCREAYPDVLAILEVPEPFRGRRNEPARVRLVAERLAGIRGVSPEAIAAATTANARRIFRLPVEAAA